MNKQEVMKILTDTKHDYEFCWSDDFLTGFIEGINCSLKAINQLDESVKPIVPPYIDTWIKGAKYNGFDLYEAMTDDEVPDKVVTWIVCNPETFAKAWVYGYEVEKEKLYTVKFANKDFGKIYIGIFKAVNKLGISSLPLNDDDVKSWFTEDELKKLKFWKNSAFEINEVKK